MTNVEEQLRATFRRHADFAGEPTDVYDAVLVRYRRSRRLRVIGAAAAACALVLVAVPVTQAVLDGRDSGGVAQERYPLPPRGSLAGDEEFLAAVVQAPWGGLPVELSPPVDTRQVVYAGEVAGQRWARVVGPVDGELWGAWLSGPAGADGATLTLQSEPNPVPPGPAVFYHYADGTGVLLVISDPGDEVAVSERPDVDADGTVVRDYRTVDTVDGVAAAAFSGEWLPGLSVRIDRGSEVAYRGGAGGGAEFGPDDQPARWTDEQIAAAAEGALGATPNADVARHLLEQLTHYAGYAFDELEPSVLWAGPVGDPNVSEAQAVLVSVTFSSGAVAILGGHGQFDSEGRFASGGTNLLSVHPSGTAPEDLLLVMRCDLHDGSGPTPFDSELVVLGPTGGASFRALGLNATDEQSQSGRVLTVHPGDSITGVQVLDEAGNVIAEEPVGGVQDVSDAGSGPGN